MDTVLRFLYEFFDNFVSGLQSIWEGIVGIFNFGNYVKIINNYSKEFEGPEWLFILIAVALILIILGLIGFVIFIYVKRFIRNKTHKVSNESLLEEVDKLNNQVRKLMKENAELMAMKVSQLGLNPDDEDGVNPEEEVDEETKENAHRFPKLELIDEEFKDYTVQNYNNNFTLEELTDNLRAFSASTLKLYYDYSLLRTFIAGLASSRLIILQGISGTGKTSLAYAWGKFVANDSVVASVQPSWKDKTEFLGYFNEFTKKFTETEALGEIYAASFDDNVHTIILDEMNIARVEYYFAEMLSVLEIPARSEWVIELVTSGWPHDAAKLDNGKLLLPGNLWYIGTINNDDSTYMVTDKVYDRAVPIDINKKIKPFDSRKQDAVPINATYLEGLFAEAIEKNPVSKDGLDKLALIDDYVIKHFRIAFGNRIMKQLTTFAPVYVACGGQEIEAIDYFIARKILRKFEQLNIAFIRDELDPFISFLNKECGKGVMKECIEFIEYIKKSI